MILNVRFLFPRLRLVSPEPGLYCLGVRGKYSDLVSLRFKTCKIHSSVSLEALSC